MIEDRNNSWKALHKVMTNKSFNRRIKNIKNIDEGHLILKEAFSTYKNLLQKDIKLIGLKINKFKSYKHINI